MILFSDLHLREETAEVVFTQVLPGIIQAALGRPENPVIGFLGDWYHGRHEVSVKLQNWTLDALRGIPEPYQIILLVGNHDQTDDRRNALEVFDALPRVTVVTDAMAIDQGYWQPYRRGQHLRRALGTPPVLFGHAGVAGAMLNDHVTDQEGAIPQDLQAWQAVLLGHYHKQQTLGNVHYIGSPYQTRASEAGEPKGYAIWNGSSLERVNTIWGPRYHSFSAVSGVGDLDLSQVRPGDLVNVTGAPGAQLEAMNQKLGDSGAKYTLTPADEAVEARLEVSENASMMQCAEAYVDLQAGDLDKARLMETYSKIAGEL